MKSNEIRKFINLMESINDKIENKSDINEANPIGQAISAGKIVSKELEPVFNILKKDRAFAKKLFVRAGVNNADDFLKLVKNDFISIDKASTKVPKLLPKEAQQLRGAFELNILKSNSTNAKLLDIAAENLAKDAKFIEKYKAVGSETDLINKLKQNGYSDQGAKAIAKKRTYVKNNPKPKPDPNKPKPDPNKPKPIPPQYTKWWDELIKRLKQKKTWKQILAWGLGVGIPASILYAMVTSSGEPLPEDIEEPKIDDSWAPCIQDLIKNKQGVLRTNKDGSASVLVKSNEYPEGLLFYTNSRVLNVQTKEMGSWSCKNAKPTLQESSKMSLINILNEQGDDLANDVNQMIDYLDFPVTYNNLVNAKTILKKYSENGRGKEFLDLYQQSGLGGGGLDKTLRNVKTIEPKSVQVKNQISQLYNQIQSGKVTSTNDNTNKTGGLDGISITWDGKKTDDDKPTPPTPPKPKYYDCSQKPLPHEFGCRSEQIKEVQKCLGLEPKYQTGNFGPITMKALGGNQLTKEVYEKIKSECGSQSNTSSSTTDYGLKGLGKFNKKFDFGSGKYRSTDGSQSSTDGSSSPVSPEQTNVESPEDLYNRLKSEGLIEGDEATTFYTDENGNQRSYGPSRRIVYKGPELEENQYKDLNSVITKLGYTDRLSQVANKKYGIKYVWVKKK